MNKYKQINLYHLDRKLKCLNNFVIPDSGWINKIRKSLDITFSYIAKKLNTSPQVIKKFEQNEVEGTITLNTLKKIADTMECNLVYAFVPKDGSFEKLINRKANIISNHIAERVSNSMKLEMQKLYISDIKKHTQMMQLDILKHNFKILWNFNE